MLDEARYRHRAGDLDTALARIDALLEEDPTNFLGAAHRAEILADQGESAAAERAYRRLIELRPSDPSSHGRLGIALARMARDARRRGAARIAARHERDAEASLRRSIELGVAEVAIHVTLAE